MRDFIMIKWCDVCARESELSDQPTLMKVDATQSFTVGMAEGDDKQPSLKNIDTCDVHAKMFADILDIIGMSGQYVEKPKPAPIKSVPPSRVNGGLKVTCPVCTNLVHFNAIVKHVWSKHAKAVRPPIPTKCPDCGVRNSSGSGMAAHRRISHDYSALLDALSHVPNYHISGNELKMMEQRV